MDEAVLQAMAQEVLHGGDGVAHLQQFLAAGITRRQVGRLRHLDVVRRPRIGWYLDPRMPEPGVRAVRVGGVLGCTSAATSWGIIVPEGTDGLLEVSIVPGTTRLRRSDDATRRAFADSQPDVRWHWEERTAATRGWRVSPVDAILQMATCVSWRWLVVAIDSARCPAQRPPLIPDVDLLALRAALPRRLRSAVDRSDERSETAGETCIRLELEDRRIPFVPQARLTERFRPDGTVGGWLPIDIDGMASHSGREAVERDRERDALLAWHGLAPLRFTESAAVRDTAYVADVIERVWRRGAPPGLRR